MKTNAQKIADWRRRYPRTQITNAILLTILGLDTLCWADLRGADLSESNLSGVDLRWADLRGANLSGANLTKTNLAKAELRGANLSGAVLTWADLSGVDLRWADLTWTNASWVDLRGANLTGANLTNTNLAKANLAGAVLPGYMPLKTPSGEGDIRATPEGWRVSLGCWQNKTPSDLQDLIADEVDWPEAEGDEREKRRPFLVATAALMEAQAAYHPDLIAELAKTWASSTFNTPYTEES